MIIYLTKQVVSTVSNGALEILKENDAWHITYHNKIYKGSPFKLPITFSLTFTPQEVANSSEVASFLARF